MATLRSSIDLQTRDFAILRELLECRVLTLAHITALHFEGRNETAKKRIQKLKAAGLVAERPRRISDPSILFLTRRAFVLLQQHGHLADYPRLGISALEKRARVSDLTIKHELAVGDIKVAFAAAVEKQPHLKLLHFTTWPRLYEFTAAGASGGFSMSPGVIKPDGYARIMEERDGATYEHAFFIEVDRTTVTLNSLAARAVCYLDHYRSGGFAVWRGGAREEYKQYPFRVLGVFTSEKRRHNFAVRLLEHNPPIRHQFWLATFADAVADPLAAIWNRPADYLSGSSETSSLESRELDESPVRRSEHDVDIRSKRRTLISPRSHTTTEKLQH